MRPLGRVRRERALLPHELRLSGASNVHVASQANHAQRVSTGAWGPPQRRPADVRECDGTGVQAVSGGYPASQSGVVGYGGPCRSRGSRATRDRRALRSLRKGSGAWSATRRRPRSGERGLWPGRQLPTSSTCGSAGRGCRPPSGARCSASSMVLGYVLVGRDGTYELNFA
jgi:hypothetical protein